MTEDFDIGSRVIVTGDEADYGHLFTEGATGEIRELLKEAALVREDGTGVIWYVGFADLEFVTDDESDDEEWLGDGEHGDFEIFKTYQGGTVHIAPAGTPPSDPFWHKFTWLNPEPEVSFHLDQTQRLLREVIDGHHEDTDAIAALETILHHIDSEITERQK